MFRITPFFLKYRKRSNKVGCTEEHVDQKGCIEDEAISFQPESLDIELNADDNADYLLWVACFRQSENQILDLIEKGANVNCYFEGIYPLQIACYIKNVDLVSILVQNHANVNINGCGYSPIQIAVIQCSLEIVEILINQGANIDDEKSINAKQLLSLVFSLPKHQTQLKTLFEFEGQTEFKKNPMHKMQCQLCCSNFDCSKCRCGFHWKKMLYYLLEHGADPNHLKSGKSPSLIFNVCDSVFAMRQLLNWGFELTWKDSSGYTFIDHLIQDTECWCHHRLEVLGFLVAEGGMITTENPVLLTLAVCTEKNTNWALLHAFMSVESSNTSGFGLEDCNFGILSPIQAACLKNDLLLLETLVDSSGPANYYNAYTQQTFLPPLHTAVLMLRPQLVEWFLLVIAESKGKWTVLMLESANDRTKSTRGLPKSLCSLSPIQAACLSLQKMQALLTFHSRQLSSTRIFPCRTKRQNDFDAEKLMLRSCSKKDLVKTKSKKSQTRRHESWAEEMIKERFKEIEAPAFQEITRITMALLIAGMDPFTNSNKYYPTTVDAILKYNQPSLVAIFEYYLSNKLHGKVHNKLYKGVFCCENKTQKLYFGEYCEDYLGNISLVKILLEAGCNHRRIEFIGRLLQHSKVKNVIRQSLYCQNLVWRFLAMQTKYHSKKVVFRSDFDPSWLSIDIIWYLLQAAHTSSGIKNMDSSECTPAFVPLCDQNHHDNLSTVQFQCLLHKMSEWCPLTIISGLGLDFRFEIMNRTCPFKDLLEEYKIRAKVEFKYQMAFFHFLFGKQRAVWLPKSCLQSIIDYILGTRVVNHPWKGQSDWGLFNPYGRKPSINPFGRKPSP